MISTLRSINEIAYIISGGTPKTTVREYWDGNIPWLSVKDFNSDSKYVYSAEKSITELGLKQSAANLLQHEDIIISARGTVGLIAKISQPMAFNQSCFGIRSKGEVDQDYLYYAMKYSVASLKSLTQGSVFSTINRATFNKWKIPVPTINVQREISTILSSIDKKLAVNNQLNDYLAEIADSLFINTFGHLEENAVLSDIANIIMGQSPTGASYNNVGNGVVFYQGRGEFGWRFPTRRLFTTEPKRMAKAGDILMSVRAPVGDLNIAYEDCCIGRGLAVINCSYPSFCLYLMRSLCKKLNAYNSEGTVFGSINSKDLKNIEIALPNVEDIIGFEDKVVPIDNLIKFNEIENRNLSQLRDMLLSKLMSVKIHVGY